MPTSPSDPSLALTPQTLVSIDPATGEPVGEILVTPEDHIPQMVRDARIAQRSWGAMTMEQRGDILKSAVPHLVEQAQRIGELLTREMGKPRAMGIGEATYCAKGIPEEVDSIAEALEPEILEDDALRTTMRFDPYGVVAAITPWNFPLLMVFQSVIPALMAGNTVLLKPSEETPLVAREWVAGLNEFLPPNVLQLVIGDERQGKALVEAPIDLVVFTGSREAGKHILREASGGLKRVILELGGKDPMIVLGDADVDAAAAFAARNSFRNTGQVCVSTERIYVDESIADAFTEKLAEKAAAMKVGPGMESGVEIGPMINRRQKDHVVDQVEASVREGARVIMGCHGPDDAGDGNFLPLTVLADVDHDMEIMREETFGPVACVMSVRSDDEAVRLANDTRFGLAACVWGESSHAEEIAGRLTAGMIGVNQGCGGAEGSPWVGARESGFGWHGGRYGHRQFCQVRTISRSRKND
ncbi:MAG: aldehyde dehydrogenase [Phycisphaerae bacterium]|nr:aldehyde dehydrogenase [Phycisphaerae bacterium]